MKPIVLIPELRDLHRLYYATFIRVEYTNFYEKKIISVLALSLILLYLNTNQFLFVTRIVRLLRIFNTTLWDTAFAR